MNSINLKTISMLFAILTTINLANAQTLTQGGISNTAMVWVGIIVIFAALIIYMRVCQHKKIYKKDDNN